VHVFAVLLESAFAESRALVARVTSGAEEVTVELHHVGPEPNPRPTVTTMPSEASRALGCSVVRHILAAHGGKLERHPRDGVSVRVTLPAAPLLAAMSSE
jgi:hypothetical protein